MRVAIAVTVDDSIGLDSAVSPHFGRCPYYLLVDLDGTRVSHVKTVENPYHGRHEQGQVPGFIKSHWADVILAGGMGRRAIALFQQYGIKAVTGASGTARDALEQYLDGALQGAEPCRESIKHNHDDVAGEDTIEGDEVSRLREDIETLRRQLDEARKRLEVLTES
jgi:predicted Fe-Mo cluster-binding NifX family protein